MKFQNLLLSISLLAVVIFLSTAFSLGHRPDLPKACPAEVILSAPSVQAIHSAVEVPAAPVAEAQPREILQALPVQIMPMAPASNAEPAPRDPGKASPAVLSNPSTTMSIPPAEPVKYQAARTCRGTRPNRIVRLMLCQRSDPNLPKDNAEGGGWRISDRYPVYVRPASFFTR